MTEDKLEQRTDKILDQAVDIAKKLSELIEKSGKVKREDKENLADQLLEWLIYAGNVKITLEQRYRLKMVELENKEYSHASAENRAKTTREYELFKKIEMLYSLGEERIRLTKISLTNNY